MHPLLARRRLTRVAAIVTAATCTGCFGPPRYWTDNVVWSPDGSRAAVLADALYLTDPTGQLTPTSTTGVHAAAWLHDNRHLVLATSREAHCFQEIADAIGPERTADLAARAERLLWQAQGPGGLDPDDNAPLASDVEAILLYLREHRRAAVLALDPGEEEALDEQTATLHSLVLARVLEGRVEPIRTVWVGFEKIHGIRPAPDGRRVAFVTQGNGLLLDGTIRTLVVSSDGSSSAHVVSEHTAIHPDWTTDGRSLVFLGAEAGSEQNESHFGCLFEEAIDPGAPAQSRCLVRLLFDVESRVRVVTDSRVLFDAPALVLPRVPPRDGSYRSSLFTFDRRTGALEPLIRDASADDVAFFELAPDRSRVLIGWANGRTSLVSPDTGEQVALRLDGPASYRPMWSGPAAMTFVRDDEGRLVLVRRERGVDTVLSERWPERVVRRLFAEGS